MTLAQAQQTCTEIDAQHKADEASKTACIGNQKGRRNQTI